MKAYTDIEQSKKLAEILPLESADMHYSNASIKGMNYTDDHRAGLMEYNGAIEVLSKYIIDTPFKGSFEIIPCWSLAALLEKIPEIINFDDDESDYALEILKENGLYYLSYGNPLENGKIEIEPQEDFIDACCEMIIKLHEQNIL